jgi:hypothetical protein
MRAFRPRLGTRCLAVPGRVRRELVSGRPVRGSDERVSSALVSNDLLLVRWVLRMGRGRGLLHPGRKAGGVAGHAAGRVTIEVAACVRSLRRLDVRRWHPEVRCSAPAQIEQQADQRALSLREVACPVRHGIRGPVKAARCREIEYVVKRGSRRRCLVGRVTACARGLHESLR